MARPYFPPTTTIPTVPTRVPANPNGDSSTPFYLPVYAYPTSLLQDQNPNYPYLHISVVDSVVTYGLQFVVALPMPNSCKTSYGAIWEELNLGQIANLVDEGVGQGKITKENVLAGVASGITNVAETMGQGEVANAISRRLGLMINPHAAVIFKGMPFRELSFTWTFYPKNSVESLQIKSLIYSLKWAMHPELVNSGGPSINAAGMKYPMNFVVEVFAPRTKILFRTSAMALINCEVEYCGAGRPSFFQYSDDPVAINVTLTFKELEIITRKRIEQGW